MRRWVAPCGLPAHAAHNGEGERREDALTVPRARLGQAAERGERRSVRPPCCGGRAAPVWLSGEGRSVRLERYWLVAQAAHGDWPGPPAYTSAL
ncbi:hypothetical protein SAMN00790413_01097 [Deinococcus hopiensis KR-140]|uniref:Uncharacterized protein n=1 Tax=Deinococcus hopiensis KR-140 TaxID=695939 RepID=A0A1W1VDP4_9DEIO|nr:hypothetical protein SAMN00790413_01097 [Deinococcus hopiensis KR-140]